MRVRPDVRRHVAGVVGHGVRRRGNVRVEVGARVGPVRGRRREYASAGGRDAGVEVQLWAVVVAGHEEVRLVLVGWVARRGLRGLRQPLEVELVGVSLSVHFRHDVLVVVVPVGGSLG